MSEVKIRKAIQKDIPSLLLLLQQLFSIEEDFTFVPDRQQAGLLLLLSKTNAIVVAAEKDDKIIGMATGQLVISTAEGGASLWIEDVVVDKQHQKRGIGSQLLLEVAAWGKEQGARRTQLLADKNNSTAIRFYKNNNWQQTALICLRKYHQV